MSLSLRTTTALCGLLLLAGTPRPAPAADSPAPTWSHGLPGPDWRSPWHHFTDSLEVSASGATVLTAGGYPDNRIWQLQIAADGSTITRRPWPTSVATGRVLAQSPAGATVAESTHSPEFQTYCALSRVDFQGGAGWLYSFPPTLGGQPCWIAIPLADGGVATVHPSLGLMALAGDGSVRWSQPLTGSLEGLQLTGAQRLLAHGYAVVAGVPQRFTVILDSQTGTVQQTHRFPDLGEHLLQSRHLADGGAEVLVPAASPNGPLQVLRFSAEGLVVARQTLDLASNRAHRAHAHADGFLVEEYEASEGTHLVWFQGSQLRWRSAGLPFGTTAPRVAISSDGEVAYDFEGRLYRLDARGADLPSQALPYAGPSLGTAFAPDGSVWTWGRNELTDQDMAMARFAPAGGPQLFARRLALPLSGGQWLALEPEDDGSVRSLAVQSSRSPDVLDGRLVARHLEADGQVRAQFDRPWPETSILAAYAMTGGWMLLTGQPFGYPNHLRALDLSGNVLWERQIDATVRLACNRTIRCALHYPFSPRRVELFDFNGSAQGTQAVDIAPRPSTTGQEVHGLSTTNGTTTLWSLNNLPATALTTAPVSDDRNVIPLLDGLLTLENGELRLHQGSSVRPLGVLPGMRQAWSTRRDQALLLVEPPSGSRLEWLRLDVLHPTQPVRRSQSLPPGFRAEPLPVFYGETERRFEPLDAYDHQRDWLLARRPQDAHSTLFSMSGEGSTPQSIRLDGQPSAIRALPGGDAAVIARQLPGKNGPELELVRIDLPLFRDGME